MPRNAEAIFDVIYKSDCWFIGRFSWRCTAEANWKILKSPWHLLVDVLSAWISKAVSSLQSLFVNFNNHLKILGKAVLRQKHDEKDYKIIIYGFERSILINDRITFLN